MRLRLRTFRRRPDTKLPFTLLFLAVLLLFLSGCRIEEVCCTTLDISTVIRSDGSGTKRVAVAIDETVYELALLQGEDPFADLKARAREIGARIEPYHRDNQAGIAVAVDFTSLGALNQGIATRPFETVHVEKTGLLFEKTYSFQSQIDTGRLPPQIKSALATIQDVDFRYSVTLPGNIVSHNANEVDGNRLTWYLDPRTETVYELRATSQRTDERMKAGALVVGISIGLIVLGGGLLFVTFSSRFDL